MNDVTGPDQAAPAVGGTTARQIKAMFDGVPLVEIPLEPMRRSIARRLIEAKQTIPHFYLTVDIEMDRLASMRSELNAQAGDGGKISINDFIIKAMSLALQRVPKANAVWAQDCILRFEHSDVAVAMAVESGLFTPVIRQAEIKSIGAISEEVKALAERARSKALKSVEYRGGSITISNLGMYGVRSFSAIVNPPQSAILAVGATDRRPVEGPDSSVRFASVMTVTLSCDHRVIDGVLGAQLLAAFKLLMEAPRSLLG
jgi:pyruvate dehydrogenase E2 component (dihydrolipoamide acetyltransferase)